MPPAVRQVGALVAGAARHPGSPTPGFPDASVSRHPLTEQAPALH